MKFIEKNKRDQMSFIIVLKGNFQWIWLLQNNDQLTLVLEGEKASSASEVQSPSYLRQELWIKSEAGKDIQDRDSEWSILC